MCRNFASCIVGCHYSSFNMHHSFLVGLLAHRPHQLQCHHHHHPKTLNTAYFDGGLVACPHCFALLVVILLAMVAESFAPAAAVNLYCHSDAVQQPTPPGDLRETHEMMVYAVILLAPCLADVFAKGFLHWHHHCPAFDVLLLKHLYLHFQKAQTRLLSGQIWVWKHYFH